MEKLAIETADQLLENHEDIGNALRHLTLLTESAYDKETASQMRYHVEQVWITRIVQGRK